MLKFVGIKFFALALSSTRSLLLAAMLGPRSYGIFGTLILVQQYLSYAALGVREGVTVTLARAHGSSQDMVGVYGSALAWGAGVGLAIWIALWAARGYAGEAGEHLGWIGIVSLLSILNEILININRDQDKLSKVAKLEVLYNAVPLGVALWLWKDITIAAMLRALAVGLLVNVVIYVATLPHVGLRHVQWRVTRQLLSVGFPLSALAGVCLFANSIYVVLANRMGSGNTLGLVVFANTVCTVVLFALNTVAWGATSRSMRHEFIGQSLPVEEVRAVRLRTAFRVGIAIAAVVCISTTIIFTVVMKAYAGAEVYAFYLCLFQAYGLLLFDEINQINVTGHSRWVIAGYCALVALVWGTHYAFPAAAITTLMLVGIVGHFILAFAAVRYSETLKSSQRRDRSKVVFLLFPVVCALLYAGGGSAPAVLACLAFAALALWTHRAQRMAWQ